MVWACFAGAEKGLMVDLVGDPKAKRGGVTGRVYLKMLQNYLPEFQQEDWILMQDNALIHTYRAVKAWFETTGYNVMNWPPYSPDLNPIELVWVFLKQNLHKYYPEFINMAGHPDTIKPKLAEAIIHCWELLDPSILENLARTMPRRVKAVIAAKAWYTKY